MKKVFFAFAFFALAALLLFGCARNQPSSTTPSAATGADAIDFSLDSFDASLIEASGADAELDSAMPSEFNVGLLD